MENIKADLEHDTTQKQEAENYLKNLMQRFWALRLHFEEVIDSSVKVLEEIRDVSSCILSPGRTKTSEELTRTQQLINEFEALKTSTLKKPAAGDMHHILKFLEHLHDTNLLERTRLQFHRTKNSLKRVDTYFKDELIDKHVSVDVNLKYKKADKPDLLNPDLKDEIQGKPVSLNVNLKTKSTDKPDLLNIDLQNELNDETVSLNVDLKNKINERPTCLNIQLKNKINQIALAKECKKDTPSRYASCCDSEISLDVYHSTQDLMDNTKSVRKAETGYEGDYDECE